MRIAYLHGLETKTKGPKNDYLREIAKDVYDPILDYRDKNTFSKVLKELKEFKPDFIIGSSMGGYFAFVLADYLGIPAVLFNPALHSRSIDIELPYKKLKKKGTRYFCLFGKNDNIIEPRKTVDYLRDLRVNYLGTYFNGEHRVHTEVFKEFVGLFTKHINK